MSLVYLIDIIYWTKLESSQFSDQNAELCVLLNEISIYIKLQNARSINALF